MTLLDSHTERVAWSKIAFTVATKECKAVFASLRLYNYATGSGLNFFLARTTYAWASCHKTESKTSNDRCCLLKSTWTSASTSTLTLRATAIDAKYKSSFRLSKQLARGSLPPALLPLPISYAERKWPPRFSGKSTTFSSTSSSTTHHQIVREAHRIMSISRLNAGKQKLKCIYVMQKYLSANVYKRKSRPTIEFTITSFTEPDSLAIYYIYYRLFRFFSLSQTQFSHS